MKIAMLANPRSVHTIRWADSLAERGHDVHVITVPGEQRSLNSSATRHVLTVPTKLGYVLNGPEARRTVHDLQPDLLHAHYASSFGLLGRLCDYEPYIISVWGSDVYTFPNRSPLHHQLLCSNLRAAGHLCSTSRAMAKRTREVCPNLGDISITPFGVDIDQFDRLAHDRDDYGVEQDEGEKEVIIGTVKSLTDVYGIDILIRAFARTVHRLQHADPEVASRLRLRIVGGGPARNKLERLAEDYDIAGKTTFVGRVDHNDVPVHLSQLDIYVAVSRSESFGVAVLEASASGRPVIVSDVGGLPEVVNDGETGIVVPTEDPERTAQAILQLIQNPELRKDMGEAGRDWVHKQYSWSACVDRMESIYNQLAK